MLSSAGQNFYMARMAMTAAQLAPQKAQIARANLAARQQKLTEQKQTVKKRRSPYEDVKALKLEGDKTLGDLKLTNQQYRDIRKQVFGTTRASHGGKRK